MNLGTTNLLLGIMAAVMVIELLGLIAVAFVGYQVYGRVMQLIEGLEQREVAPAMARVNAILDDVKEVSGRVSTEAERVDQAIRATVDRVDETADRVRTRLRVRARRMLGIVRGIQVAIETFLSGETGPRPSAPEASRP